jgi:hypothetical protein
MFSVIALVALKINVYGRLGLFCLFMMTITVLASSSSLSCDGLTKSLASAASERRSSVSSRPRRRHSTTGGARRPC